MQLIFIKNYIVFIAIRDLLLTSRILSNNKKKTFPITISSETVRFRINAEQ